jgi:cytochrome c553
MEEIRMRIARLLLALLPFAALAVDDEFAAVRDTIQVCAACHGELGAKPLPNNPILAGQEYYYLYTQLKDFKSGLRQNDIMKPIADPLDPDQMKLLAKFFSIQTWPAISHEADRAKSEVALRAIESGECSVCHLGDFRGDSRTPRLAGQAPDYLERTMLDYKSRARNNAPDMGSLLALSSEDEIKALADYLASLSVYQRSQNAEPQ